MLLLLLLQTTPTGCDYLASDADASEGC